MSAQTTPFTRRRGLAALLAVPLAGLTACGPFGDDPYTFQGTELDPAAAAPSASLVDQRGQPYDPGAATGRVSLLFFGFTHCPDVCPTTLSEFIAVRQALGDAADQVDFLFVTVDPARDTTDRIAEYLAFFDPSFIGLTGDPAELQRLQQGYGVFARAHEPDANGQYNVDHTAATFAVDRDGEYRATWAYGTPADAIAADVRHLVDE
jgi:protein SCO1